MHCDPADGSPGNRTLLKGPLVSSNSSKEDLMPRK